MASEDQRLYHKDGGFEMYGNKGTDGLLYADRTPLPNYYELQHNYARAFVRCAAMPVAAQLTVVNRYDFLNLKGQRHLPLDADQRPRHCAARRFQSRLCPPVHPFLTLPSPVLPLPAQSLRSPSFRYRAMPMGTPSYVSRFVLNKPHTAWTGHGSGAVMVRDTTIRTGRKPTMCERLTQKQRIPNKYLLPLDNHQVKADIQHRQVDGGETVTFTLTPDTTDVFRSELGLAYLLDPSIDRVQWIGYGPFASYPGRYRANRYGFWAQHMDDLYFEGNHSGIDAAFFSDKDGNGLLVVGDSLNLNFEQTDRGIVMTVNAAVSGQGPKFAKTAFPGWKRGDAPVSASFRLYRIEGRQMPQALRRLFLPASQVPAPFKPFLTQYDTYLLRY